MVSKCKICGGGDGNRFHSAREMMFGTRDEFVYLECGTCGTVQITEIPDLSGYYTQDYYSFDATGDFADTASWKQRLATRMIGDFIVNDRNFPGLYVARKRQWIAEQFPPSLREEVIGLNFRSRILDFGCGSGRLLRTLRLFGFCNLTGADAFINADIFYPSGVKIYRQSLDKLEPSYDLIMLHHSFEHLPDPSESFAQIRRLLAKSGICLVRIPVVNFAWEKYGVNWVQLDPPRHLFLYTENSFRQLAKRAGFIVERVVYDSEGFQFWGSEQYVRDISMNDKRAYKGRVSESIFTTRQLDEWQRQAEELNARGLGDQACFYLRKQESN